MNNSDSENGSRRWSLAWNRNCNAFPLFFLTLAVLFIFYNNFDFETTPSETWELINSSQAFYADICLLGEESHIVEIFTNGTIQIDYQEKKMIRSFEAQNNRVVKGTKAEFCSYLLIENSDRPTYEIRIDVSETVNVSFLPDDVMLQTKEPIVYVNGKYVFFVGEKNEGNSIVKKFSLESNTTSEFIFNENVLAMTYADDMLYMYTRAVQDLSISYQFIRRPIDLKLESEELISIPSDSSIDDILFRKNSTLVYHENEIYLQGGSSDKYTFIDSIIHYKNLENNDSNNENTICFSTSQIQLLRSEVDRDKNISQYFAVNNGNFTLGIYNTKYLLERPYIFGIYDHDEFNERRCDLTELNAGIEFSHFFVFISMSFLVLFCVVLFIASLFNRRRLRQQRERNLTFLQNLPLFGLSMRDVVSPGVSTDVFKKLPQFRYADFLKVFNLGEKQKDLSVPTNNVLEDDPNRLVGKSDVGCCCICLDEFKAETMVSLLPCSHIYHHMCISSWFQKNKMCPLCKRDVTSEAVNELLDKLKQNQETGQHTTLALG